MALIYANNSGIWLGAKHGPVLWSDCEPEPPADVRTGVDLQWYGAACGDVECGSAPFEAWLKK
jgi:hypothetical protein